MSSKQTPLGTKSNSNDLMEEQLRERAKILETKFNGDLLFFDGPIMPPTDDIIKDAIEEVKSKTSKLIFMIETEGGYIETAKRIVEVTRHHYETVEFVIPNYAMSAGTILVMSGDSIYMNYYSTLGPIDPQVEQRGRPGLIPALGYLKQYERLIEKSQKSALSTAEMAFLIEKFDPAELYKYEQERELSRSLLKEWLVKYKFKNWKKTETRNKVVTPSMKTRRASEIAKKLNDTDKWHSHSCGISLDVLQKDLQLKIEDYDKDNDLLVAIKNYYNLISDYSSKRNHNVILHCKERYFGLNIE